MNYLPPYHFLWDDDKAVRNERQHHVSFDGATSVFDDPLSQTIHDLEHSDAEDRWIIIGYDQYGALLVVVYACEEHEAGGLKVRIISSRKATRPERHRFEAGKYFVREPVAVEERSMTKSYADMDELPPEFFEKAEVGKFYHENAVIQFPVYLDPEVLRFFRGEAAKQYLSTEALFNQILKREMAQIRAASR